MNNVTRNIRNLLLPASFFIPFTFYFLLFAVGGYVLHYLLNQQATTPGTSFGEIFALLIRVAEWFIGVPMGFALLTTIVALLYFLIQKRKGHIKFFINTAETSKARNGNQQQ